MFRSSMSRPGNPAHTQNALERLDRNFERALRQHQWEDSGETLLLREALRERKLLRHLQGEDMDLFVECERNPDILQEILNPKHEQTPKMEALQRNANAALFGTTVAAFIERQIRPDLIANRIIKRIRVTDLSGTGAIKVPVSAAYTASEVADDGTITPATSVNYTAGATITISPKAAAQRITNELLNHSNVDLAREVAVGMGNAISRKIDVDALTAFDTATPAADTNGNYDKFNRDIRWSDIETYVADMQSGENSRLETRPDTILTNPTSAKALLNAIDPTYTFMFAGNAEFKAVPTHMGLPVISHPSVTAKTTYLIDAPQCGYVMEEDTEMIVGPGRVSATGGTLELIAIKYFGVDVVQTSCIHRILDNTP